MKKTDRQKLIRAKRELRLQQESKIIESLRSGQQVADLRKQLGNAQRRVTELEAANLRLDDYRRRTRRIIGEVYAVNRPDQCFATDVTMRMDRDALLMAPQYRSQLGHMFLQMLQQADRKAFNEALPDLLPENMPVSRLAMLLAICVKEMDYAHARGVQAEYCLAAALNLFFIVLRKFADDHSPDKWPTIVRAVHEMMRQEMSEATRNWSMAPFPCEVGQLMIVLNTHECRKTLTLKNPFYVKQY